MRTTKILGLALALLVAGCGTKRCKDGTLLLNAELQGATAAATQLGIEVDYAGQSKRATINHTPGKEGAVEVDFGGGYPSGQTISVTVNALDAGGNILGTGTLSTLALTAKCEAATVVVSSSNPQPDSGVQDLSSADLSGDMVPATAALSLDNQPSYDFGQVTVGSSPAPATLTVTNVGSVTSSAVSAAMLIGDGAYSIQSDGCQGQLLAPAGSCQIVVSLSTASKGTPMTNLSVSATEGGSTSVALTATIVTAGAIVVTSSNASPMVTLPGSADITATVQNSGGTTTGAISWSVDGSAKSDYTVTGGTCTNGQTLAASASCTLTLHFVPASAGARNATLTVNASPGGPGILALSGTGATSASVAFTQSSYTDSTAILAGSTDSLTLTLHNSGSLPSASLPSTIQTTKHNDFVVASGGTCALGSPLAGGASCTILVTFQPSSYGAKTDTLSINIGGANVATNLLGTGEQTFTLTVTNSNATGSDEVTSSPAGDIACGNGFSTCSKTYTVTTTPPSVTLTPTAGTGSRFSTFGNACSGTTCSLSMGANYTVTATWVSTFTATVTFAGTGGGTVTSTSSPAQGPQLNCSSSCTGTFDVGMTVSLSQTAKSGDAFTGWGGDCSGSGACSLTSSLPTATVNFGAPTRVAYWALNGTLDGATTPVAVTTTATNVTAGSLSSAGLTDTGQFANAFMATNWPTGGVNTNQYFQFSVTPASGHSITYGSVDFSLYNNFDGQTGWQLRSSVDGYASAIASGSLSSGLAGSGTALSPSVTAVGTQSGTVTFRFYTFSNSGTDSPTQRGFRGSNAGGTDLAVYGVVAP